MDLMWKAVLAFAVSLVTGFLIARPGKPTESVVTDEGNGIAPISKMQRRGWTDFRSALKAEDENRSGSLFPGEFEDWTTPEIAAAVNEGLSMPERVLPAGSAGEMMNALLCEWVRRDLDGALKWFENLPTDGMRNDFGHCLAAAWPRERAEEGLEFVFAHPRMFDREHSTSSGFIIQSAIEKAAEEGASAVADVLARITKHHLTPRYAEGWRFPEDFDFARLADSPQAIKLEQGYAFFAGVWMSRNPGQAFARFADDEKVSMKDLFADVMPQNGTINHVAAAERARWVAGRLNQLDGERSGVLLAQSVETFIDSPETLIAFTVALERADQRCDFSANAVRSLARKSILSAMDYLEATELPEQRLAALEAVQTDYRRYWRPNDSWERSIREKLISWHAAPERVDAIVDHLKIPKP